MTIIKFFPVSLGLPFVWAIILMSTGKIAESWFFFLLCGGLLNFFVICEVLSSHKQETDSSFSSKKKSSNPQSPFVEFFLLLYGIKEDKELLKEGQILLDNLLTVLYYEETDENTRLLMYEVCDETNKLFRCYSNSLTLKEYSVPTTHLREELLDSLRTTNEQVPSFMPRKEEIELTEDITLQLVEKMNAFRRQTYEFGTEGKGTI